MIEAKVMQQLEASSMLNKMTLLHSKLPSSTTDLSLLVSKLVTMRSSTTNKVSSQPGVEVNLIMLSLL